MKSKRTIILLIIFIAITIAAVIVNTRDQLHPDSLEALRKKHDDYTPLVVNGEVREGIVTHRALNGLMIHLKETPNGYEPILGIYENAEGAKVHVEDKNGIMTVHTHSYLEKYELGRTVLHDIKAVMTQMPPDQYYKGPSIFLLGFRKQMTQGTVTGEIRHDGRLLTKNQTGVLLANKRFRRLSFEKGFPDYPKGSILHIRFELDGKVAEAEFPVHELPPAETVSRQHFKDPDEKPRFD